MGFIVHLPHLTFDGNGFSNLNRPVLIGIFIQIGNADRGEINLIIIGHDFCRVTIFPRLNFLYFSGNIAVGLARFCAVFIRSTTSHGAAMLSQKKYAGFSLLKLGFVV